MKLRRWTWPDCYLGASWEGYYSAGVGQSRDSDCLERSNFQVMRDMLAKLPEWNPPDGVDANGDEPVSRYVVRESHWAVGWIEWIAIHESDAAAIELCEAQARRLENYPVLDEMHYSELEWNEVCLFWERMTVADRVELCQRFGLSVFAARRPELPQDDNGALFDYLRTP